MRRFLLVLALGIASLALTAQRGGNQTFTFAGLDGTTEDDSTRAGEVRCGDADVHLPENTGRDTAELVIIEFKDRETFKQ